MGDRVDELKGDEQVIEKMKNLVIGAEGMVVIFHSENGVILYSKGIDERDVPLVL